MSRVRIGVLISGSGSNLQSIIDNINNGFIDGDIKVVISNKEDAYGLERARQHNIDAVFLNEKSYKNKEEYNKKIIELLDDYEVELVVLAGYLKILTKEFINQYENKIINIHPSLIPSFCGKGYYGMRVHEEVINYGVKITGATVHFVNEKADEGPIILQKTVNVNDDDTKETIQNKVLEVEHELLPMAVKLYCENRLKIVGRKVIIK